MVNWSFIQTISLPYHKFIYFNLPIKDDFSDNEVPQFFNC
jgi:hypothetical protein